MIKDKMRYHENKYKKLARLSKLANEPILYQVYYIRPIEKEILKAFVKEDALKLAKRLGVHRSYVYAVLNKFDDIYSTKEIVEEAK